MKPQIVDLNDTRGYEQHNCHSRKEGDLLIYECPQCDYVRTYNRKTQKWASSGGTLNTLHQGLHIPVGINPGTIHAN